MDRISIASWSGPGKEGQGIVSTQSGALAKTPFTYHSRYLDGLGTNPEELIAAAHASCFTMKLSFLLGEAGFPPGNIETRARVTLQKNGIVESHLHVKAKILGIAKELFEKCANNAKENCPVSRALKVNITMNAELAEVAEVHI